MTASLLRKYSFSLVLSVLLTGSFFVISSCGGGSSSASGPPYIAAELNSFPTGSVPQGFNNNEANVSVVDSSSGSIITNATVIMNGVTLLYNGNDQQYEGNIVVPPGMPITLSISVNGSTYTASTSQYSSCPVISSPAPNAIWSVSDSNTVTWSGGSPTAPNALYGLGILDANNSNGNLVWPSDNSLQTIPIGSTSCPIPANSLSAGSRVVIVGIATTVPVSGAADGSIFVVAGFNYAPLTVTTTPSPTNVTVVPGNGQATISWTAVSGATSYNIYWSTNPNMTQATGTEIVNATSPYTLTGLTDGTTYYYSVSAVSTSGESERSNMVSTTPVLVMGIAGGYEHSAALEYDGTVWTWGEGGSGQLGNNTSVYSYSHVPVQVCATAGASAGTCGTYLTGITTIAAGQYHTVALKNDGTVWAWGDNFFGELGNNNRTNSGVPVQVCATAGASAGTCSTYLTGVTAIAAGYNHTVALKNDGTVWAWGQNQFGQLGNNTPIYAFSSVPVQVCATATCSTYLTGISAIAGGNDHTVALKNDGTVWTWGYDSYGQLGNNNSDPVSNFIPVQVCATAGASAGTCGTYLTGVTAIGAGQEYSVVLENDGTVWTWGYGGSGQLGNNSTTSSNVPVQVCATAGASAGTCGTYLTGVTAIAAGEAFNIALENDGTVRTWGEGPFSQLGNNSTTSSNIPVQVCATAGVSAGTCGTYLTGITTIAAGWHHSLALENDGTVWAWGYDASGQLGNNSIYDSSIPVQSFISAEGAILAPSGLTAGAAGSTTIGLTWTASTGASSYNLYWSTQSNDSPLTGAKIPLGNITNYAQTGLTANTRYYYVVTAVDSVGNESPGSNVATAVAQ